MIKQLKKFLADREAQLEQAGELLTAEPIPELTEELFSLFEKTGNRLQYEAVYFKRRKYLSVFALLSMRYGRKRDFRQLETVIAEICKETCWALPAHVGDRRNPDWKITVDLFAAETAFALAEITGRLAGKLSSSVCERAKQEVFRRVLTPYINSDPPYAWWETSEMNWNAVCCGSIGGAALWLMREPELKPLLFRVCGSLSHYLDGFCEDGACLEGLGYYTYGMSFYTAFADLLAAYAQKQADPELQQRAKALLAVPKMEQIALFMQKCFVAGGRTLSFSDGSSQDTFRMGLAAYLAMQYPAVRFPDFSMAADLESDPCYRYLILSRDFFFTEAYLARLSHTGSENRAEEEIETRKIHVGQVVLPEAQWSVCTSAGGSVLAVKGGHNGEPHNHNDTGSFLWLADGQELLTDLGAGEYTKDYFGENRYTILCCRSKGHNVPLIDGKEQKAGAAYGASFFETDGRGTVKVEFAGAYGLGAEGKILRTVSFDLETGEWQVRDEFTLPQTTAVTENLISKYPCTAEPDGFTIHAPRGDYRIRCEAGTHFRVEPDLHRDHVGASMPVWRMQWEALGFHQFFTGKQLDFSESMVK